MNSKFKIIIAFIGIIVFSSGCTSLVEEPQGLLTPDSFYSTTQDLQAGVVAAYRPFMEYYLNAQGGLPAMGGDDVTTREGGNKEPYRGFDRFTANPAYEWLKMHTWDPLFQTIFHANAVINNYENVSPSFARDAIAGEASFLRAWAYFRLVRTFGPVPLITGTATGEEPRDPVDLIYTQIIADLQFAEEKLPGIWFGEPGRVTKWGAKSLLAKVYLTSAGWPLNQTGNYSAAAAKAKEVIDGSTHRLEANFADLWQEANENNNESILAVQACADCGDWGLANRMPYSIGAEAEEGGWDDYYAEIEFFESFPDGPRKDATFQTTFGGSTPWENTVQAHPYYHKTRGFQVAQINSLNEYVIRLADVYLMYAEAQNKADGSPNADAYSAINKVRRRAAGANINNPNGTVDLTGLSGEDFHKAVLDERAWELCAEWERWFDLVRNQMVAEATANRRFADELPLNASVDVNSEASFEPYYWAPIPQNEMLLRPDWEQNPCCR